MFRPLPLILILAVMLTSIGLGAARGTVRMGDKIVLCTGHGVVVVQRPGDQGDAVHLCPDMALSLLAAVVTADVALPQRAGTGRAVSIVAEADASVPQHRQVRVRGPPFGSFV